MNNQKSLKEQMVAKKVKMNKQMKTNRVSKYLKSKLKVVTLKNPILLIINCVAMLKHQKEFVKKYQKNLYSYK